MTNEASTRSFKLKVVRQKWVAELVATVTDIDLIYASAREIMRDLEMDLVKRCEDAGFRAPEDVLPETQLGLFGGSSTVTLSAHVVKAKKVKV